MKTFYLVFDNGWEFMTSMANTLLDALEQAYIDGVPDEADLRMGCIIKGGSYGEVFRDRSG